MIEQVNLKKQNEAKEALGRAFMGTLMGVGTICGIWFASGLVIVLSKLMA